MYLNILLVQEQQGQQAEKRDGEIGLWAPLATQSATVNLQHPFFQGP